MKFLVTECEFDLNDDYEMSKDDRLNLDELQIELEDQTFALDDGSSLPLQVGMSLSANIKLRKVSYLQLLFSNFEKKRDALKRF